MRKLCLFAASAFAGALVSCSAFSAQYALDFTVGATVRGGDSPVVREAASKCVADVLKSLATDDTLTLKLFSDVEQTLTIGSEMPGFAGARPFSAHLGDGVFASIVTTRSDGSAFLEVRDLAAARLYRAAISSGVANIEEVDLAAVRRGGCIEVEAPEYDETDEQEETDEHKLVPPGKKLLGAVPDPFGNPVVAPAPVMVDIMIVFDNGAREWTESNANYGGSITNFAVAQVAKMNGALVNTGLHTNFWFRLVDVATVNGRWTAVETPLSDMRNGIINASGIWSEIAARREACGADLVSLMIDTGSSSGTMGIGYITHGETEDRWSGYYRQESYSCCAIGAVDDTYTLLHEVGHNMGLTHSPTLAGWDKKATFDYSNGYNITNANDGNHYHTIMAYPFDKYFSDYVEIPYFSSPLHDYAGVPVGTAISNDCTRTLRQTCSGIAKRWSQKIPLPSAIAFSPNSSSTYRISLSTLGGYEIRYTTDGSEPTRESTLYEKPIKLTSGEMTVKAVAVVDGETLGAVAEKTYSAAVELDKYVWLEYIEDGWKWSGWNYQNGNYAPMSYWNSSSDKTALIDIGGRLEIDRDITLDKLLACSTDPLEIAASSYNLFSTNIEVFGATTLSGTNFAFDNWSLHDGSTLVVAPGEGNVYTINKYLALGETGSTLAVSNGTLKVTKSANSGDGTATLQNSSVRIDDGGILSLDPGWVLGYANTNPVTVNKGGLLKINALESTTRPLVLNGGNVEINLTGRAYEMRSMSISVTDDSSIIDTTASSGAEVYPYGGDVAINVSEDKTLTVNATITTKNDNNINGRGINKRGKGEIRFLKEISHSGTNTVNAGTFTIAYNSSASRCLHWSVANGATLKIEDGGSLVVPSLALSSGATLVLPASATAPLAVSNSVSLAGVSLMLENAANLELGAGYALAVASGGFTDVSQVNKNRMPELSDDLAWSIAVEGETLYARVKLAVYNVGKEDTVALATIVDSGATAVTGEGTVDCGTTKPNDLGWANEAWKGTVAFEGFSGATYNAFQFELYGNAKSKIQLTNCAIPYLKNNNATFAGTLVLASDADGNAAFATSNGYSANYNAFGALEGDGSMAFTGPQQQAYVFNVATNFTGSITIGAAADSGAGGAIRGRRVVFGNVASEADLIGVAPRDSKSATVIVRAGATASIGANATWNAYHGVEVAGTLLVKGANSTLDRYSSGTLGLVLDDGATLRFDSADAKLTFGKELVFTNGTVDIAFAEGVEPTDEQLLVSWPSRQAGGEFKLVGLDGWELVCGDKGLSIAKSFAITNSTGGSTGAYIPKSAVANWLDEADSFVTYTNEHENATWQDFLGERGANGHTYLENFILGYDADEEEQKFQAKIEIVDGKVTITTTEGTIPEGVGIVKRLFKKATLDAQWNPPEGEKMDDKTETFDGDDSGFYKVEVSVE